MTTLEFTAPTKHARKVQDLVKKYDGRFVRNPFHFSGRTRFTISFEDSGNANKFSVMKHIINQPYM